MTHSFLDVLTSRSYGRVDEDSIPFVLFDYVHPDNEEVLWRADANVDIESHRGYVHMTCFRIIKHTKRGVIIGVNGGKKFVLGFLPGEDPEQCKRYAYPTKELAIRSLIRRQQKRIGILQYQLQQSEAILQFAKSLEAGTVCPITSTSSAPSLLNSANQFPQ